MANERLKSPRARLFVALDLPERVRASIVSWQREALGDSALRAVDAPALHVTLCFLGDLPEPRIAAIEAVLGAVRGEAVGMRLEAEPRPLPPRGRARLYALAAPSEDAVALQRRLLAALFMAELYRPEEREFWPHVTVARVRTETRSDRAGRRQKDGPTTVGRAPDPLPSDALEPFEAVRVTLYRSNLRSHGAEYVSLASIDLTSPPVGGAKKE